MIGPPTPIPSTWNWTPATPDPESDALATKVTVLDNDAPPAGDVTLTVGGVLSGGGGGGLPAALNATICMIQDPLGSTSALAV